MSVLDPQTAAPRSFRFECHLDSSRELAITRGDRDLLSRLGFVPEELQPAGSWLRTIPPEDVGRCVDAIDALLRGLAWEGRVRMLTRSRDLVILAVRAIPVHLAEGGVSVSVEASEVTDLARLESALAEAQGALRMVDEIVSIARWTTDSDLRFVSSSGSLLGAENSLVGTSLYDWFSPADPDIPPIAIHLAALRGETRACDVEWEGREIRVVCGPLLDELGRIRGVTASGVDLHVLMRIARSPRSPEVSSARHERIHPPADATIEGVLRVGGLVIDLQRFEVRKEDRMIPLTVMEFKLLTELALYQGSPLSRRALAKRVWGHADYADSPAVTMAISRLRDKVEDDPANPTIIETVRGVGYRMADEAGAA